MCNYTLLPASVKVLKHPWKQFCESLFSSSVAFLTMSEASQKPLPFNAEFSRGTGKKSDEATSREYERCSSVVTLFFCEKFFKKNWPVCWSNIVKEKPTLGSPFFAAFPSDRIPKATKDVNVHLLVHSSNSTQLHQRVQGTICNYYVLRYNLTLFGTCLIV